MAQSRHLLCAFLNLREIVERSRFSFSLHVARVDGGKEEYPTDLTVWSLGGIILKKAMEFASNRPHSD